MKWFDPPDQTDDGDACYILGEETVENGKTWYVCDEPNKSNPNMDCEPIEGFGNMDGVGDDRFLCKESPPETRARRRWVLF